VARARHEAAEDAILIKLGGSLITDKQRPDTPRVDTIERLAAELVSAASGLSRLVIAHGSGSFGHAAAARFRLHEGLRSEDQLAGISLTQSRAAQLHRLVFDALERAGLRPFSIAPSSALVGSGTRRVRVPAEPLLTALRLGLRPVLYGDVLLDRRQGVSIGSTETVLLGLTRGSGARSPVRGQGETERRAPVLLARCAGEAASGDPGACDFTDRK
jgi:isopentenyl phosphate kinase